MLRVQWQRELLFLVVVCIFYPLFACDRQIASQVVLKYSEEDIVNFLIPYTWAEEKKIASKDELVIISLSDPKISSRLVSKKDQKEYVISLWEKAQRKLSKTCVPINSTAYIQFRYSVFSDVMSRLLLPYINGSCYTDYPDLECNDKIIRDCLCDLFWGYTRHKNNLVNLSIINKEPDRSNIFRLQKNFFQFCKLFPELYGGGQGYRFTLEKFENKIKEMDLLKKARELIDQKNNSINDDLLKQQIDLINNYTWFSTQNFQDRSWNNISNMYYKNLHEKVGQNRELGKKSLVRDSSKDNVPGFWTCPWLLYPLARIFYDSKQVKLSRSKWGLGLARRLYEFCWSGSAPAIENPWLVGIQCTSNDNGAAPQKELEDGWNKFYEDRFNSVDLSGWLSCYKEFKTGSKSNDLSLEAYDLALAIDHYSKTAMRYKNQVKNFSTSFKEALIKLNEGSPDYWPLKALAASEEELTQATGNFLDVLKVRDTSFNYCSNTDIVGVINKFYCEIREISDDFYR